MSKYFLTFFFLAASVFADNQRINDQKVEIRYPNFHDNSLFSSTEKKLTKPYLLPLEHPAKQLLDTLFKTRVSQDSVSLESAGFIHLTTRTSSFVDIIIHPLLPNYVIKLYRDDQLQSKQDIPSWRWLVYRCEGAKKVAKVIEKYELNYFVVPKKWIYPLPKKPAPPNDPAYQQKHSILIADWMPLINFEENLRMWKEEITKEHLDELFLILTKASSVRSRPDNIHFMPNGQLAIVETEYPFKRPDLTSIRDFLSDEMREYWDELIK